MLRSIITQAVSAHTKHQPENALSRSQFRALIQMCNSDAERERIRYVVSKTSGLSQKKLTEEFGISNVANRKAQVDIALKKAQEIRESVYKLSEIREKAMLLALGVDPRSFDSDATTSSETESETDSESEMVSGVCSLSCTPEICALGQGSSTKELSKECAEKEYELDKRSVSSKQLLDILKQHNWNWFAFADVLKLEQLSQEFQ